MHAETPKLTLEPASVWRRLAAFCYDLLLLTALVFVFTMLVVAVRLGALVPPWWVRSSLLAIAMLFFCGFWVHGGQTLGMRAWRIRVVRADGGALTWPQAAARFAAGRVAAAPAGLGWWWSFLDADKRGWHDRWTGTRVVRAATSGKR